MAKQNVNWHTQWPLLKLSSSYIEWNREFERLKRKIARGSGAHLYALRKAGASEDALLELLALSVYDSDKWTRDLLQRKKLLANLANQLLLITNFAERLVNDPLCDGRHWLALLGHLPWGHVPQCGVIEAPLLKRMREFIELVKARADAMGDTSRMLGKVHRSKGMRDLVAYVRGSTKRNFDGEIAVLLTDAYEAAGKQKQFSAEQIKKFRQRHFPKPRKQDPDRSSAVSLSKKTLGQRIAATG